MKATILNIIKYILDKYPHKSDLSASRLTKMLYLIDWKYSIDNGEQLTDASWHFNHYGPYVDDFVKMAREDESISVKKTQTMFGGKKTLFSLTQKYSPTTELDPQHKITIDFVIEATKSKNYEDFIHLVYSTYPVISNDRYSNLNLSKLASEYKAIVEKPPTS